MSTVKRNGTTGFRPEWNYIGVVGHRGIAFDTLEMLESVRNVLEQIQKSQCDVANAIKRTSNELIALNREIRGLRRDLKGKRK